MDDVPIASFDRFNHVGDGIRCLAGRLHARAVRRPSGDGDQNWRLVRRPQNRWNLSPLEERWEALEALEKGFHDTRARTSTENIGLARLAGGLELVRVGQPKRPEFAAWRYGDQFGRRRKKYIVVGSLAAGMATGLGFGWLTLAAGSSAMLLPFHLWNVGRLAWQKVTPGARVHTASHGRLDIPHLQVGAQKLRPTDENPCGWLLDLGEGVEGRPGAEGRPVLEGPDAVHALSVLLPRLNASGAGRRQVQEAVGLIGDAGSPEQYFRDVELRARRRGWGYSTLARMPRGLRLALEMSANEGQERAALEG